MSESPVLKVNISTANFSLCVATENNTCGMAEATTNNPFILVWYLQVIYISIFAPMVAIAAGGNIIIIWIVLAHKRMRTVTNYFIVNLAASDALISILNTMFNFIYMLYQDWPFGTAYCKFSLFIAPCTISVSVFTFMAIAIDRYMVIIHPLKAKMRARQVLCLIAFIWSASSALAAPCVAHGRTHTWFYPNGKSRTICYMNWPDGIHSRTDFAYNIFLMLVNYFAPLTILAFTYSMVGVKLWGHSAIGEDKRRQMSALASKRRVVKMMIMVVVIFGICWLPQHTFLLLTNKYTFLNLWVHIQHVYLIIYWVAMSNSVYNPIIYYWMNEKFRNGFQSFFRWLPCIHYRGEIVTSGASQRNILSARSSSSPAYSVTFRSRQRR